MPYLDSGQKKVACDGNLPPSATGEQAHDTEKVDPSSLTEKQILIEDGIDNYAKTNLPTEIIKMIFVDVIRSSNPLRIQQEHMLY